MARTDTWSLVSESDREKLAASMPDVEDAYPLVALQAGMLFHSEMNPETAVYHDVFSCRIRAVLDAAHLRTAVARVLSRHAVLRTSFNLKDYGQALQLVHAEVPVPLAVDDLQSLSSAEQESEIAAWREAEKGRPFAWDEAPLLRFQVHRLAVDDFQLTLSFHHAICDGWSVATMLAELFAQYGALMGGDARLIPSVPELTYRDFVALEQSALGSAETRAYWARKLAGRTVLELPRLEQAARGPATGKLGVETRVLDEGRTEALKSLAQRVGVPLKNVLLAAHVRVMGLVGNQTDVLTGLVSNSRPEESDGERVLGLFLNTLPLRYELSGGTWQDLARGVFAAEQELLPHRRYPMGVLQRDHGNEALFETAFNFNHFHVYQGVGGQGDVEVSDAEIFEYTNFTLMTNFDLDPENARLTLRLNYDSGQVGAVQAADLALYYERVLANMVADPDGSAF